MKYFGISGDKPRVEYFFCSSNSVAPNLFKLLLSSSNMEAILKMKYHSWHTKFANDVIAESTADFGGEICFAAVDALAAVDFTSEAAGLSVGDRCSVRARNLAKDLKANSELPSQSAPVRATIGNQAEMFGNASHLAALAAEPRWNGDSNYLRRLPPAPSPNGPQVAAFTKLMIFIFVLLTWLVPRIALRSKGHR